MKALAVLAISLAAFALACSGTDDPESELPPREPSFNSVFFIDDSRGWLTAYLGKERGDVILQTTDGGETWEEQYSVRLPDGGLGGLQFIDDRTGWAVSSDSRSGSDAKRTLLATTNAGATWTELGELENLFAPQFVIENAEHDIMSPHVAGGGTQDASPGGCKGGGISCLSWQSA